MEIKENVSKNEVEESDKEGTARNKLVYNSMLFTSFLYFAVSLINYFYINFDVRLFTNNLSFFKLTLQAQQIMLGLFSGGFFYSLLCTYLGF